MSLLVHLNPVLEHLQAIRRLVPGSIGLSKTQKIIVISVTASVVLLGGLARYMRRKKQPVDAKKLRKQLGSRRSRLYSGLRSPNADLVSLASSGKRSNAFSNFSDRLLRHAGSVLGSTNERGPVTHTTSVTSGSLISGGLILTQNEDGTDLTPQQLGVMGMEALETCTTYWDNALAVYRCSGGDGSNAAILDPDEAAFCRDLHQLLEAALELREHSEVLFLDERSVLFRPGSSAVTATGGAVTATRRDGGGGGVILGGAVGDARSRTDSVGQLDADMSEKDSFASAQDMVADLREFEEFTELFPDIEHLPLYQAALRQLETTSGIPCRTLRTDLVRCGSDGEYLAKLHCVRLAFQHVLRDPVHYEWFADAGRQCLVELLLYADRDPKEFLIGYDEMMRYLENGGNWREIEEELSMKGVKALTFYDIVLDYILMDAFEDLESPPGSVTAVVQNRWLSNGFKETALTTAVWSVLKAKRKLLRHPTGFMAHFYTISEQLSPLLAWGFLGPDECLRDTCVYFRQQVMAFLGDIFSFQKCRYTCVEELAVDVLGQLKVRVGNICQRLSGSGGTGGGGGSNGNN